MIPYILAAVGGYLIGDSLKGKQYADGGMMGSGETYFKQQAELKGGIDYFSVDIDTEDGEQIRDLKYKSYQSAKKVYDKYKKSMQYKGSSIDDIQLIVGYKNGDYDSIGGKQYAEGGITDIKIKLFDIDYDTEDEDVRTIKSLKKNNLLPQVIETTAEKMGWDGDNLEEFIENNGADFISDETGFLVNSFNFEISK